MFFTKGNYVNWSESYSMGIKLIDDQHKGLLRIVNELFAHTSRNAEEERAWFKAVIQRAVKYINEHFTAEERYMKATKFPGYAEHKRTHEEFVLTVVNSAKDFQAGKRLVIKKFAYYLKDWIFAHIAVMDRQYSDYYKKIAVFQEDGRMILPIEDLERPQ